MVLRCCRRFLATLHWQVVLAPVVFLAGSTLAGITVSCYGTDGCPRPRSWINLVVASAGPLLPLLCLLVRGLVRVLARRDYQAPLGGPRWLSKLLLTWMVIAALRLGFYRGLMGTSRLFSDHLFLLMSIVASLELELTVAHVEFEMTGNVYMVLPLMTIWVMLLALCYEAWVTARYYHSAISLYRGFLAGMPFFGVSWAWLEALRFEQQRWPQQRQQRMAAAGAGALPLLAEERGGSSGGSTATAPPTLEPSVPRPDEKGQYSSTPLASDEKPPPMRASDQGSSSSDPAAQLKRLMTSVRKKLPSLCPGKLPEEGDDEHDFSGGGGGGGGGGLRRPAVPPPPPPPPGMRFAS